MWAFSHRLFLNKIGDYAMTYPIKQHSLDLIDFINKSPSAFQCCDNIKKTLLANGFIELHGNQSWSLKPNEKYFVTKNNSSIIAFKTSNDIKNGFNISAAHTDSPCISIKPKAETIVENSYVKLNTEVYGGAILSTWLDRPLAVCGKVFIKTDNPLNPAEKIININKPIAVIPNLAIHLNREINNGYKFSKQKDMEPILSLVNENLEKNDYILNLIAEELKTDKNNIVDFELYLYDYSKGCLLGLNEEFISSARLDDLMMVYNILKGFLNSVDKVTDKTKVIYFSDNEEIGSETSQGAKSSFLKDTLNRICLNDSSNDAFYTAIENSIIISADLAHALHPNHSDKTDPTNRPILGSGLCLKYSASQRYSTNSHCGAIFTALCDKAGIKLQKFANHSDIAGGTTIGPMLASEFSIPVVDMGAPILSMHSIRELAAVSDNYDCLKLFETFYSL